MEWPEVVVPLAGIFATLVGTFAGIFAGIWTERARWERERREMFHPDRYAKYTAFLETSNQLMSPHKTPEEDDLFDAISEAYAHIEMLGSKSVQEAAQAYFNGSIDSKWSKLTDAPVSEPSPAELTLLRQAFIEAARKELGITAEDLT